MPVATAYDDLAEGWDAGAGHVYRPLARALVAASPVELTGRCVLDVGSGTGLVAEAATAQGARVVAVDQSAGMIAYGRGSGWEAVAGDALALPFSSGVFDGSLAGFMLNHLPVAHGLAELARVVRPGGVVLSATWAGGRPDPVKAKIDGLLRAGGWSPPAWYREMKERESLTGDPDRMAATARAAGLTDVRASVHHEDLRHLAPAQVVAYRMAVPHIAPWVDRLDASVRDDLIHRAAGLVAPDLATWQPGVVLLVGRVGPQPKRRVAARSSERA